MPSSPSSLSSPEKASAEERNKNKNQNQCGHRFRCLKKCLWFFFRVFILWFFSYIYIYMSKNIFSCVLHTANTLTYFEHSFKKKNIQSFKRKCVLAWIS